MPENRGNDRSGTAYDYLDQRFSRIAGLGSREKAATCLAQDGVTGKIFVKKYISAENAGIYERLKEVRHRNLVRIYHVARKEAAALVIMEYVGGQTMEQIFMERGMFSEREAENYFRQMLEGLEAVHKVEVIHRDISPKNLLISVDGVLKILDFDIGRMYKQGQGCDTEILGTAGYAAPEQFGFMQSDKRSDIYAAGVVANQMLMGLMPQECVYTKGRIGRVIAACIQMDPKKRYQNAREALKELQPQEGTKDKDSGDEIQKRSIWPGFRSGNKWKKAFALTYYIIMGIYSVGSVAECARTFSAGVLELAAVLLYIWLSVFLAADFLQWMERTPGIRRLGEKPKGAVCFLLWLGLFLAGYRLEQYVRVDLLHIAVRKNK